MAVVRAILTFMKSQESLFIYDTGKARFSDVVTNVPQYIGTNSIWITLPITYGTCIGIRWYHIEPGGKWCVYFYFSVHICWNW